MRAVLRRLIYEARVRSALLIAPGNIVFLELPTQVEIVSDPNALVEFEPGCNCPDGECRNGN